MKTLVMYPFVSALRWFEKPPPAKDDEFPTAWRVSGFIYGLIGIPILFGGVLWFALHMAKVLGLTDANDFSLLWAFVFGSLIFHLILSWTEKRYEVTTSQRRALNKLTVGVVVPVHREDPEAFERAVRSLFRQTRKPNVIHVVENGDRGDDDSMRSVREWFDRQIAIQAKRGIQLIWDYIPDPGKRGAQLVHFRQTTADITITMDSDTVADRRAVEEGLKPFADARIASVSSIILAYNNDAKLVRLTDAWLLSFQLAVRAAMSRMGCVLVNSGNFALYRTSILKEAIHSYESEYFMGHKVEFSDDSLLTLFSYLRGRTVQQPTSFAFTVLPERVSHHLRQQLRWMRGSTIRSMWRFRYLPVRSIAYWEHFASWLNFVLVTMVFVWLVLLAPFTVGNILILPLMAGFAVAVAYMTSLRYLTIRRSDQSVPSQVLSFALSPVMLAWTAFVLRSLRLYAIATCWKTGWGTRQKVEVELSSTPAPVAQAA